MAVNSPSFPKTRSVLLQQLHNKRTVGAIPYFRISNGPIIEAFGGLPTRRFEFARLLSQTLLLALT